MKLYIKEHVFTWGDKFTVLDEQGNEKYIVEGEVFSWGKKLHIFDRHDREVAFIKQELLSFLPCYRVYVNEREVAKIRREFTFFLPKYRVEGPDWEVSGNFIQHDYQATKNGRTVVEIEKEWVSWGDCYEVEIADGIDEVLALATVVTIDCMVEQQDNN